MKTLIDPDMAFIITIVIAYMVSLFLIVIYPYKKQLDNQDINKTPSIQDWSPAHQGNVPNNFCRKCSKPVGNNVFTVCDDCWED